MASSDSKGYYKILDLAPSATQSEVRQAFLKFARKWHPDLYCFDKKLQDHAETRFIPKLAPPTLNCLQQYAGSLKLFLVLGSKVITGSKLFRAHTIY